MSAAVEKVLDENRDKISGPDAQEVESAIAETRKAIDSGNTTDINQAVERLTKASHRIAELMYQQASTSAPTGTGTGADGAERPAQEPEKKEGEVIDAEFIDVDEDKGR